MNKMDEIILVAPRVAVFMDEDFAFEGALLTCDSPDTVGVISDNIDGTLISMRRGDAEENEDFKQPIPYGVLRSGDYIYAYERLSGGGEGRLHNKVSIGVGGHMNPIEGVNTFSELLMENLSRELEEELEIESDFMNVSIQGYVNDDSDEVGRVHIGVLADVVLSPTAKVTVRETEQLRGFWITLDELKRTEMYERLENWSKTYVDMR